MSQMENKPSQTGPNLNMPMSGMGMGMAAGAQVGMGGPGVATRGHIPPPEGKERQLLHTYIYDYFLKNNMFDCAHSMIKSSEADVSYEGHFRRSPRQKHEGEMNGIDEDAMETGDGSNQRDGDEEPKTIKDLPVPKVPAESGSFLFDWWCCFMDVFYARNKAPASVAAQTYVQQTQQAQRLRQEHLLRQMNPQGHPIMSNQVPSQIMSAPGYPGRMMPNGAMHGQDGAPGDQKQLQMREHQQQMMRTAIMNNRAGGNRQPMGSLKQPHQMPRPDGEVNEMNGQPRPNSPATSASPSQKRRRVEDGFQQVENGRGAPQVMPPGSSASAAAAHQTLVAHGINPNQLSAQQFAAFQGQNPITQQRSIQMYAQSMAAATGRNLQNIQGGPMQQKMPQTPHPGGSPMMPQTSEGSAIMPDFYANTPNGVRGGGSAMSGTGNHALQDYQIQLMLLEQQNKKRLMMARQEQDQIAHHGDGQRRIEGQPGQFQNAMSPGSRTAPSPQPGGKPNMTGTPKMPTQIGPGSPAAGEGQMGGPMQQRPASAAGFNAPMGQDGHQMIYMKEQMGNALANPNMPNGPAMMRPPSSHPGQPFNSGMGQAEMQPQMNPNIMRPQPGGRGQSAPGSMWQQQQHSGGIPTQQPTQQQQLQQQLQQQQQQQQQAQQAQQAAQQQAQANGPPQAQTPQQQVGTPQQPQQRQLSHAAMPPPPGPTNAPANGRPAAPASPQVSNNQPPTPTQSNKPAPGGKKPPRDTGNAKKPRPKKGAAAASAPSAVTPSSEPPTPTTPITPQHANSFNGTAQPRPGNFTSSGPNQTGNGQHPQQPTPNTAPAAVPPAAVPQDAVPTPTFPISGNDEFSFPMDLGDNGLDNFDFDSFLNTEDASTGLPLGSGDFWPADPVEAGAGDP